MLNALRLFFRFPSGSTFSQPPAPWVSRTLGVDLRSLALFRICLGLILLCDLFVRAGDLGAFYTDAGVLPRASLTGEFQRSDWLYSFHLMSGGAFFQVLLFLVAAVAVGCMTVGYRTKTAAIVSFVLLCSLQNRNPFILQGGDALLRVMHFWALFLPLGRRWALDLRREGLPVGVCPSSPNLVVSVASAAILFQVAFMYWFTAGLKSDPIWWRDGLGVYYALNVDQFTTPLGTWMLRHEWLHRLLSYATWWLEALGPLLAFVPWRTAWFRMATIAAFIFFHLFGINLTMELGLFQWTSSAIWLLFLPGLFWDRLAPAGIRKIRRVLAKIDATKRQKTWIRRSAAVLKLGFRPEQPKRPKRPSRPRMDGWKRFRVILHSAAAAVLFLYALAWNVRAADFDRYVKIFPRSVNWIGELTGLRQYWSMFSPKPMRDDGWYVFTGRKMNGDVIDLRTGKPVTWHKPARVSATYKNQRWRKYLMNLRRKKHAGHRKLYVPWVVRQWNRRHSGADRVVAMQMVYVKETTTAKGTEPAQKLVLWEYHAQDRGSQLSKK